MAEKLIVKSSPHLKTNETTQQIMADVLIALLPAVVAAVMVFGTRALLLIVATTASAVLFEYLFRRVSHRETTILDLSAAVTGVLLALNLPVTMPIWMAVLGSLFAIVLVKQLFGGIGHNFANPAIAARIFLMISFATPMTTWMIPSMGQKGIELVAGATPLKLLADNTISLLPDLSMMFLGVRGGCLGETSTLALLIGGLYLLIRRIITPTIPLCYLGGVVVLSMLFGVDPLYHLMAGGLMIGAFFMATDYSTSPATEKGKVIFGLGCALITMLIRVYGSYPEGVSYAILFMNILTPHINRLTRTTPFSVVKAPKVEKKEGAGK